MDVKKINKLFWVFLAAVIISASNFFQSHAMQYLDDFIDGIQIQDKFYSIDYIIYNSDEFQKVFGPADVEDVIIDFNRRPVRFSDYINSVQNGYGGSLYEYGGEEGNQTNPFPAVFIGGSEGEDSGGGNQEDSAVVINITPISNTKIEILFESSIEQDDITIENFAFDNDLNVVSVEMKDQNSKKAVLTTSAQDTSKTYALTYLGKKYSQMSFVGLAQGKDAPQTPQNIEVNEDGELENIDQSVKYEYQKPGESTWTEYTGNLPDELKGEIILVRQKATEDSPAGTVIQVLVPNGVIGHDQGVFIEDVVFESGTFLGEEYYAVIVDTDDDVFWVDMNGQTMIYEGSGQYSIVSASITSGDTITIKAYDGQDNLIEENKYKIQ